MTTVEGRTADTRTHRRAARIVAAPAVDASRDVHAELTESADGWTLTLHCDAATAAALRAGGIDAGRLTVAVRPNLVPGEPFAVDTVLVVDRAGTRPTPGPSAP